MGQKNLLRSVAQRGIVASIIGLVGDEIDKRGLSTQGGYKMKKDYKKSMDQKERAKRRSKKYLLVGTSIAAGIMLGAAPITIATPLLR